MLPYTNNMVEESIVVFDWDDTLFPSSWVIGQNLLHRKPTSDEVNALREYEDIVLTLISTAKEHSKDVRIVTNSEEGWVALSAARFMPRVLDLNLPTTSTRKVYGFLPTHGWKHAAFRDILRGKTPPFVCSVGDSPDERRALIENVASLPIPTWGKSIKLIKKPTLEQLQKQLLVVTNALAQVCASEAHVDLMMAPRQFTK